MAAAVEKPSGLAEPLFEEAPRNAYRSGKALKFLFLLVGVALVLLFSPGLFARNGEVRMVGKVETSAINTAAALHGLKQPGHLTTQSYGTPEGFRRSRALVIPRSVATDSEAIKLCTANLDKIAGAAPAVAQPSYDRTKVSPGIVHMGVGNFHRGHQAVFTDDILGLPGQEQWGYAGLGVRKGSAKIQEILQDQDHLFTVWQKGISSSEPRIIGCHSLFVLAPSDPKGAVDLLASPSTKIITLTVTEKGYFIDFAKGTLDTTSPDVQSDIAALKTGSDALKTPSGFIIAAAKKRAAAGTGGFGVLSCDNVPENGQTIGTAVIEMAEAADPATAEWIKKECTFPNSMVDRIVPSTTDEFTQELATTHKIKDGWPILSEEFNLWVIEDKFPQGRPSWEKAKSGQCLFVEDVVPYELMKLRLLNSAHQAMAYPGALLGYELVHEAMADSRIAQFMEKYGAAAARTVPAVKGIDKDQWTKSVIDRFANPNVRDTIFRLNQDATNRIAVALAPMLEDDSVAPTSSKREWLLRKLGLGSLWKKKQDLSLSEDELSIILLPVACWLRSMLENEADGAGPLPAVAKLNIDDRRESIIKEAEAAWNAAKFETSRAAQTAAFKFIVAAFGDGPARPAVAKALVGLLKKLQSGGVQAALDGVNR